MSTIRAIPVTVLVEEEGYEDVSDELVLIDMADCLAERGWNVTFKKVPQITLEEFQAAGFSDLGEKAEKFRQAWEHGLPRKKDVESSNLLDGEECKEEE